MLSCPVGQGDPAAPVNHHAPPTWSAAVVALGELVRHSFRQEAPVAVVLPAPEPGLALVAVVAVAVPGRAGGLLRAAVVVAQTGWVDKIQGGIAISTIMLLVSSKANRRIQILL